MLSDSNAPNLSATTKDLPIHLRHEIRGGGDLDHEVLAGPFEAIENHLPRR